MTVRSFPALCLAAALLGACASEAPYLLTDYRAHQAGYVKVCYAEDESTPEQVWKVAEKVCNRYQRTAKLRLEQPMQCSWTAPSVATFVCKARPGETPPPLVPQKAPMRHGETTTSPY